MTRKQWFDDKERELALATVLEFGSYIDHKAFLDLFKSAINYISTFGLDYKEFQEMSLRINEQRAMIEKEEDEEVLYFSTLVELGTNVDPAPFLDKFTLECNCLFYTGISFDDYKTVVSDMMAQRNLIKVESEDLDFEEEAKSPVLVLTR